jgi:Protein of unknown function (DUF992)
MKKIRKYRDSSTTQILLMRPIGLAVLAASVFASAPAQAARIEVGVLRCSVAAGVGFIIGSRKSVSCVFRHRGGADEYYQGRITKLGIDIGYTRHTSIVWAVLAPTANVPPASLAGRYGGVSAEATLGAGLGANALIGGSLRSVVLQPLSVQGQTGLNVAAGVAGLVLRSE